LRDRTAAGKQNRPAEFCPDPSGDGGRLRLTHGDDDGRGDADAGVESGDPRRAGRFLSRRSSLFVFSFSQPQPALSLALCLFTAPR
jgi:hypothetical protein